MCRTRRTGVLFVTHDVAEAVYLGDCVDVVDGGRIAQEIAVDLPDAHAALRTSAGLRAAVRARPRGAAPGGRASMNRSEWPLRAGSLLLAAGLLLAWEAACRALRVPALVLPPPSAIARALWQGLASGYFWPHLRATALELGLGVVAGSLLGFSAGVLLGEQPLLRRLLMPYVVASQVVPKLALAPLFVLWFGFGMTSTIVITALICFFR
jgi:hypothetical protein